MAAAACEEHTISHLQTDRDDVCEAPLLPLFTHTLWHETERTIREKKKFWQKKLLDGTCQGGRQTCILRYKNK